MFSISQGEIMNESRPETIDGMEDMGYKKSDFHTDPAELEPEEWQESIDKKIASDKRKEKMILEREKQKKEILEKMHEEEAVLKPEQPHKSARMGSLIDFLVEVSVYLSEIDPRAKDIIKEEFAFELERKIDGIANTTEEIDMLIEALETTYLEQLHKEYLRAQKDEDVFDRTHPDDYWTSQSKAAIEVQEKRADAYKSYSRAQTMVKEIVPVLRIVSKKLSETTT